MVLCLLLRDADVQTSLARPPGIIHHTDFGVARHSMPQKNFARPPAAKITPVDEPVQAFDASLCMSNKRQLFIALVTQTQPVHQTVLGLDNSRGSARSDVLAAAFGCKWRRIRLGHASTGKHLRKIRGPEFPCLHFRAAFLRHAGPQSGGFINEYGTEHA